MAWGEDLFCKCLLSILEKDDLGAEEGIEKDCIFKSKRYVAMDQVRSLRLKLGFESALRNFENSGPTILFWIKHPTILFDASSKREYAF